MLIEITSFCHANIIPMSFCNNGVNVQAGEGEVDQPGVSPVHPGDRGKIKQSAFRENIELRS